MAHKAVVINSPLLFPEEEMMGLVNAEEWKLDSFSAKSFYTDKERLKLEEKNWKLTEV